MQGISNYLFGADGHHLVVLTGPGNIWLQSMPIPVLAGSLAPFIEKDDHGGRDAMAGGAVGGIFGQRASAEESDLTIRNRASGRLARGTIRAVG